MLCTQHTCVYNLHCWWSCCVGNLGATAHFGSGFEERATSAQRKQIATPPESWNRRRSATATATGYRHELWKLPPVASWGNERACAYGRAQHLVHGLSTNHCHSILPPTQPVHEYPKHEITEPFGNTPLP